MQPQGSWEEGGRRVRVRGGDVKTRAEAGVVPFGGGGGAQGM